MKKMKILISLTIAILTSFLSFCQQFDTSKNAEKPDTRTTVAQTEGAKKKSLQTSTLDQPSKTQQSDLDKDRPNADKNRDINWLETFLILSPMFFSGFVYLLLFKEFKRVGFSINDALTEFPSTDLLKAVTDANNTLNNSSLPNPTNAANPANNQNVYNNDLIDRFSKSSSSRLIAFITTICVITLSICFAGFYMYLYIKHDEVAEFDHLGKFLLALGVGVVPYGVNKISEMFK